MHIEEHVPRWWGIITVEQEEQRVDFYILRKAVENPKRNLKKKLGLLWRPELAHMQEQISQELYERDYQAIGETIQRYKAVHSW